MPNACLRKFVSAMAPVASMLTQPLRDAQKMQCEIVNYLLRLEDGKEYNILTFDDDKPFPRI